MKYFSHLNQAKLFLLSVKSSDLVHSPPLLPRGIISDRRLYPGPNMIRRLANRAMGVIRKPRGKPAIGSIAEIAAVYDDVFEHVEKYDTLDAANAPKIRYLLD